MISVSFGGLSFVPGSAFVRTNKMSGMKIHSGDRQQQCDQMICPKIFQCFSQVLNEHKKSPNKKNGPSAKFCHIWSHWAAETSARSSHHHRFLSEVDKYRDEKDDTSPLVLLVFGRRENQVQVLWKHFKPIEPALSTASARHCFESFHSPKRDAPPWGTWFRTLRQRGNKRRKIKKSAPSGSSNPGSLTS